jgi:hypothetical protein
VQILLECIKAVFNVVSHHGFEEQVASKPNLDLFGRLLQVSV